MTRGMGLGRRLWAPAAALLIGGMLVPVQAASGRGLSVGALERIEIAKPRNAFTEVPPVLLPRGRGLLLSTGWTYRCAAARLELETDCSGAHLTLSSDSNLFPPALMPARPWRRNYQGAYAAELLKGTLVTFNHAENKNEIFNGAAYQNTVQPEISVYDCWSGYRENVYRDCGAAYSGFVTATRGDLDLGPIIWPEDGYIAPPARRNHMGLRHPHSILWRGYVYVFYVDHWPGGRRAGLRVARAPAGRRGRGFSVWRDGSWVRALPRGFSKNRMERFYGVRGPKSTPLFGLGRDTGSFAVARRRDGRGFLGVEAWYDGKAHIAIRESRDLLHWSRRRPIPLAPAPLASFPLNYPVLMSAGGTTTSRVGDRFYIVGTQGAEVNRLAVHLSR